MSNFGIKISKEGDNVFQTEDKDLIYTSELFGLKVYQKGSVDVTIPGSSADFSNHYTDVSHDLGYSPSFYAFIEDSSGDMHGINSPFLNDLKEGSAFLSAYVWSDSSKIRFNIIVVDAPATDIIKTFKYYIFVEPINE